MRFTTSLLAALPALSLLTPALAHFNRPNGGELQNILNKWKNDARGNQQFKPCKGYKTRDPKTCVCEGDTVEPVSWYTWNGPGRRDLDENEFMKRGGFGGGNKCGDWPKQECVCPDAPNTWLGFDKNKNPVCRCPGDNQTFNSNKDVCECAPGFKEKRTRQNVLTCKEEPPKPEPSKRPRQHYRRSFKDAVAERRDGVETRYLESLLGCNPAERACESFGSWTCTNVMTSLATCGGCAEEAVDCAALPNVDTVKCVAGGCVIDTCARGFELNKDTVQGECVAKAGTKWFNIQA